MARWPSSLRSRLTLWYTLFLGLPLIGFALVSYFTLDTALGRHTDRFIADALSAFSSEVGAERRTALSPEDAIRSAVEEVRFRDLDIVILDAGRRVKAAPPGIDLTVVDGLRRAIGAGSDSTAATFEAGAARYRVISRPLIIDGERFTLTGSYPLTDVEEMRQRIRTMALVAVPLLVLCAAVGGYLLARRSLAPVASMGRQAASITASNLDQRLRVGGGEELVGLATVVNDLLDRLEQAFAQQRRFVADASHELRTPTAILRIEAEVTLSREERPEAEYRQSVEVMRDAARRLTRIVDELFLLARADAGHLVTRQESIYLEDVVDGSVRAVRGVAEQRGVTIELGELVEAPARGDADLLGRLLLNLLDNAIKFSEPGGTVDVAMNRENGCCMITVGDRGVGIPPEAKGQIFEPFFRADRTRSHADGAATGGAGLGLAIARRIATLHDGRLELIESRPGRTVFRLTLPVEVPPLSSRV